MNINNMVNPKAAAKTAWPEDGVQRGKTSYEKAAAAAKDGTAVKPVSYEGSKKTADTKSQNGLSSGIYNASAAEKEKEKTVSAEEKEQKEDTQKALEKTADTMTEKDCETLEEEGMTLEAYEAERLNRAIARIKENRQFEKENLEGRMERQKEYDQEIQKIALKNKIPDSTARKLGQKLIEAGLPLTEANIMAMVQALNLGAGVNEMPDSGMAYIIENNQEATIENVYNASYAGAAAIPAGEEAWEAVKSQIEEVIEKSGRPVNEETLENGKWLLDHELPVNEETLEQLENLQGIREEADEAYLLDRMTEAMVKGKTPKEANLDLEAVRSRRQLEEIRLSMSEGASRALEEKGIVIDTENMKQVIEELKKIENTYYKALLEETGGEIRPEQVNLLKETMEKADAAGQECGFGSWKNAGEPSCTDAGNLVSGNGAFKAESPKGSRGL